METKTDIAKSAALTAANFIDKGWWVEAYIELHSAARICWERRDEERQQQNAEVSEGGTRDSRIETAAQSRPSLH